MNEESGFASDHNAVDLEHDRTMDNNKNATMIVKETLQLGKNLIIKKQNLETVQEGEDLLPFSKKMDQALFFIEDALHDNFN